MRYLLVLALLGLGACTSRKLLPVVGQVPDFQLTAQDGKPFGRASLLGSVWVADFMFTSCTGPCPRMSAQMRKVQQGVPDDVKLISFSVDPKRDTPEVLAKYAARYQADPARWHFLTGDSAVLDSLAFSAFHLNRVDGSLEHSTRFVLIDRQARIRAYYLSDEDDAVSRVIADAKRLDKERS